MHQNGVILLSSFTLHVTFCGNKEDSEAKWSSHHGLSYFHLNDVLVDVIPVVLTRDTVVDVIFTEVMLTAHTKKIKCKSKMCDEQLHHEPNPEHGWRLTQNDGVCSFHCCDY